MFRAATRLQNLREFVVSSCGDLVQTPYMLLIRIADSNLRFTSIIGSAKRLAFLVAHIEMDKTARRCDNPAFLVNLWVSLQGVVTFAVYAAGLSKPF